MQPDFHIRYRHNRRRILKTVPDFYKPSAYWELDSYGGSTHVEIVEDGVVVAQGDAWCRPDERYDKVMGRVIALGRAMKNLREGVPPRVRT